MMLSDARHHATIRRLEVRATGGDAVLTRLRAERTLAAVDLHPRGLPPSVILCVRELRDPLPGALALHGMQGRPSAAWAGALQRTLDRMGREAAWPARGTVPAGAGAVAFADQAELLLCLALDLVGGELAGRWWWPLLIAVRPSSRQTAAAAWVGAVEHAPVALQRLAERQRAEAFVSALGPEEVAGLQAAIERRFAVTRAGAAALAAEVVAGPEAPDVPGPPPVAPWRAWVPEADGPGLTVAQQELLGMALMLVRAPSAVRSQRFAVQVARWRAEAHRVGQVRATPAASPVAAAAAAGAGPVSIEGGAVATVAPPVAPLTVVPGGDAGVTPSRPAAAEGAATAPARDPEAPPRQPAPDATAEAHPSTEAQPTLPPAGPVPVDPVAADPPVPDPVLPPQARPIAPRLSPAERRLFSLRRPAREFGAATETELGGLFYIVNLALYLELYGDDENLPLPIWDFLALIGAHLLGHRHPDDPVWALLAELAGRPAEQPPGADFQPPSDWRVPPRWLSAFPNGPLTHAVTGGRLRVLHAEGFPLIDVPAGADVSAQLHDELGAYGGPPTAPIAEAPLPWMTSPLERWLARLLPYVVARLERALGVSAVELPALLLEHHARVHLTDTHLDVVLSLQTLPVALRCAGLDRDPGWVAAAGRYVAFHFEGGSS
jgi:hypothetical protein